MFDRNLRGVLLVTTVSTRMPCLHCTLRDTGIMPAAKGVGAFLAHPDTPAIAMAVYGPWGQGKVRQAYRLTFVWFCIVWPSL
jgi:hypothetical protein